jgi:hypothetical protein
MIRVYSDLVSKCSELPNCSSCRGDMLFDLPWKGKIRAIQKKMVEGMNIANLRIAFNDLNRT